MEAVDFIELLHLPFSLGNAVKYIMRCNDLNPKTEDVVGELNKILYYIGREKQRFQYQWTPSTHAGIVHKVVKELKTQLHPKLHKGFYWLTVYLLCNKVTEGKAAKEGYLDRAMVCIAEYRDALQK